MRAKTKVPTRRGMLGISLLALFVWSLTWSVKTIIAQVAPPPPGYIPRAVDELQQLVAPIALYPDALLAQVLTASTYPDDVIAAARWVDAGNNVQAVDAQPWDSSVKGVARYPSVLHYMASNGDWMNDLGDAFLNQQSDVMSAVQNLRGQALAAGTLATTPQQTVINEDGYIQIIPTDPQYVYAPIYDPQVVYAPPAYVVGSPYPSYITFGPRVEVGDWLDFDLDWHDRAVYSGRWGRDRPWWHRDGGGVYRYLDDRPGVYRPGRFNDIHGRAIQAESSHWARDDHRPAPRRIDRPAARAPAERPERGYPQRAPAVANRPVGTPHGADVSRASARGQASRERAAPSAPRAAPAPVQRAAEPARRAPEPVRAAPRPATPAPEARPSAPTRGGAMGGYQRGEAASNNAARGSASRGRR